MVILKELFTACRLWEYQLVLIFTKPYFNFLTSGIYAYAILKDDATINAEDLRKDLKDIVRQKIGSFAIPEVIQVFFAVVIVLCFFVFSPF